MTVTLNQKTNQALLAMGNSKEERMVRKAIQATLEDVPVATRDANGNVTGLSVGGADQDMSVGGIVKPARPVWPGYHSKNPLGEVFFPCGTALVDTRGAAGAASSIAVDTTVTWNGKPTTRVQLTTAAAAPLVQAQSNATPSLTLGTNGQAFVTRKIVCPIKVTNNTIASVQFVVRAPDVSNQIAASLTKIGTMEDGWELWTTNVVSSTTTGTPDLTSAVRGMINVTCTANAQPGNFHFGEVSVLPLPTPSVVITLDDGTVSWPWVAAEAAKRGIPVSFGITGDNINKAYGLTEAEIIGLATDYGGMHDVNNHNKLHSTYTTLGLSAYVSNLEENRLRLQALGIPSKPLLFHAYPSGDYDQALMDALRDLGYLCGRTTVSGTGIQRAHNEVLAMSDGYIGAFDVPIAVQLDNTHTLTEAKSFITTSSVYGTAFVVGHKFEAAASATGWIKGYDDTSGFLGLLDWLAERRDVDGWKIRKWSDWYDDQIDTTASIPL